ncbi:MAG: hypothetical protein Q9164_006671 [Protoblastenia rupestris]
MEEQREIARPNIPDPFVGGSGVQDSRSTHPDSRQRWYDAGPGVEFNPAKFSPGNPLKFYPVDFRPIDPYTFNPGEFSPVELPGVNHPAVNRLSGVASSNSLDGTHDISSSFDASNQSQGYVHDTTSIQNHHTHEHPVDKYQRDSSGSICVPNARVVSRATKHHNVVMYQLNSEASTIQEDMNETSVVMMGSDETRAIMKDLDEAPATLKDINEGHAVMQGLKNGDYSPASVFGLIKEKQDGATMQAGSVPNSVIEHSIINQDDRRLIRHLNGLEGEQRGRLRGAGQESGPRELLRTLGVPDDANLAYGSVNRALNNAQEHEQKNSHHHGPHSNGTFDNGSSWDVSHQRPAEDPRELGCARSTDYDDGAAPSSDREHLGLDRSKHKLLFHAKEAKDHNAQGDGFGAGALKRRDMDPENEEDDYSIIHTPSTSEYALGNAPKEARSRWSLQDMLSWGGSTC